MFFQNPFASEFIGNWLLGDRQYVLEFRCPRNAGRGDEIVYVWGLSPYNLAGVDSDGNSKDVLTVVFALNDPKNWIELPITIVAASLAAVTPEEIVSSLTASPLFNDFFTVSLDRNPNVKLIIRQKLPVTKLHFYIKSGRAETVLQFNQRVGVAELPNFMERHTIANRFVFVDSLNQLIKLDPAAFNVDADIINNAVDERGNSKGFSVVGIQADWQLLRGRSGLFTFQKITIDGSDRITQIIEYHAGAGVGDTARKIKYVYSGTNTKPDQITEIPYVLTALDLVTP